MDPTKEVGQWFPVKDLVPWDQNPRFNNHVIDKVIKSINEFGWGSPVLARLEDRRVIAGHTRIKAAEKMGLEFIPVRFLSGLTDEQANKLALADNKLNELAEWDEDKFYDLLKDLNEDAIMDLGWSKEEMDKILLEKEYGENDPFEEWREMPEFENNEKKTYQSIIVHFETKKDFELFSSLIDQNLTEKTTYIYYPKKEIKPDKDYAY